MQPRTVPPARTGPSGQGRSPVPNFPSVAPSITWPDPIADRDYRRPGRRNPVIGGILNTPSAGYARATSNCSATIPLGVDFRPYLSQLLETVNRNWTAVMPQSVKLGRRGKVMIQFPIANNGNVPKPAIAPTSRPETLDKAAIAGITASTPFPPLPSEFKGDSIVLQFNFVYR